MNDVIDGLLRVQEVDERILAIRAKLAEGPQRLGADESELAKAKARHEDAARRAKEAMRLAERKNGELEEVDRKMKDLSLKQNTARSNKEYEALKSEIAGLRADFEILEEEALRQWEIGEDLDKQSAREQEKIGRIESRLEENRREWEEAAAGIESELESLAEERAALAAKVPGTWLGIYERVLGSRGTPAVVAVVEQYCQGCQMHISVHDITRAMRGQEVVQCHACNRILYAEGL